MKTAGLIITFCSICLTLFTGFIGKSNEPILIVFTGSDWCNNCRFFEKTVLNDSAFVQFVEEEVQFIIADFPQNNKQTKEIIFRNDSLAARYNQDGLFPKIVLLKDSQPITIPFHRQNAKVLIEELRQKLQ